MLTGLTYFRRDPLAAALRTDQGEDGWRPGGAMALVQVRDWGWDQGTPAGIACLLA